MNINYHLTEEEARDGLNGLLPKFDRPAILLGILFLVIGSASTVNFVTQGHQPYYIIFAVIFFALSVWFLANRQLKIFFISRRSASKDNVYLLTISPDGWIRPGKGAKVRLRGDDKAHAAETPLTVSIRTDKDHMYVIPKTALQGSRLEELKGLLEAAKCPVKKEIPDAEK